MQRLSPWPGRVTVTPSRVPATVPHVNAVKCTLFAEPAYKLLVDANYVRIANDFQIHSALIYDTDHQFKLFCQGATQKLGLVELRRAGAEKLPRRLVPLPPGKIWD